MRRQLFLALGLGLLVCSSLSAVGCAALQNNLKNARESYEAARYQRAAVWLRRMEPDVGDMDREMQAQYFFLYGMTSYHLGAQREAAYYLSLAREVSKDNESALGPGWRQQMDETLATLESEEEPPP